MKILSRDFSRRMLWNSPSAAIREAVEEANNARANLSGADLSGAYLSRADLSRANLSGADLSRANLSEADLSRANLSGADLSGANLSRADLSRANLSGADLSRAYLSGADLSRAYLSGADLSRANLSGAYTLSIGGSRHPVRAARSGTVAIGCHVLSLGDWRERGQAIARAEHYTEAECEEYRLYLDLIEQWMRQGQP